MNLARRRFVGGPMDGQSVTTVANLETYEIPGWPAGLEETLKASLAIATDGLAVIPAPRTAIYRLDRTTGTFTFEEWE